MPSTETTPVDATAPAPQSRPRHAWAAVVTLAPGLGVCVVAVGVSLGLTALMPTVSTLLFAIVIGVILRNAVPMPRALEPGITFAAKRLLRAGVVLLGLQLVLGDIIGLGAGMIVVVVAIVTIGILASLLIGKWLGMTLTQRLLIACGFSICGAAAVAAVDGVIETKREQEVVTAIALVVLFGTLMIPIMPALAALIGLDETTAGLWIGGSVHEVAQVVAAGGAVGSAALGVAVIVKLARVLMLAPVMAVVSAVRRRSMAGQSGTAKRPPLVPLFVLGFIAMVLLRSSGWVPGGVLAIGDVAETALLGMAMFALGTGVRFSMFKSVGAKPFVLGALTTVVVALVALAGILIFA